MLYMWCVQVMMLKPTFFLAIYSVGINLFVRPPLCKPYNSQVDSKREQW